MNEKTAIDELQFIRQVIQDSRKTFLENGVMYIFWGVLVAVAMIIQYFLILGGKGSFSLYSWLCIIAAGWGYTFYYYRILHRRKAVTTFAGKILGVLWMSTGISMTLIGFVPMFARVMNGVFISAFISIVLGNAYFISGYIYENRYITYLAFGWWLGAVVNFFYPGLHTLLQFAGMMIFFQVIPGIYLFRKSKREFAK